MKTRSIYDRTTLRFEIPPPTIRRMMDEAEIAETLRAVDYEYGLAAALRRLAASLALLVL